MLAGVPKISIKDVTGEADFANVLAPLSVLFVKGWTRGVAALAIMACCYEKKDFLEARYGRVFFCIPFAFMCIYPGSGAGSCCESVLNLNSVCRLKASAVFIYDCLS